MIPEITEKDLIIRFLAAFFAGGIIGLERQLRNKHAGIRTYTLVCLASCLFTVCALKIAEIYPNSGLIYVINAVALGIGFLGSGLIFKNVDSNIVRGLTSAAVLWITAAIGMTIGFGYLYVAGIVFILVLIALFGVRSFEFKVGLKKGR